MFAGQPGIVRSEALNRPINLGHQHQILTIHVPQSPPQDFFGSAIGVNIGGIKCKNSVFQGGPNDFFRSFVFYLGSVSEPVSEN